MRTLCLILALIFIQSCGDELEEGKDKNAQNESKSDKNDTQDKSEEKSNDVDLKAKYKSHNNCCKSWNGKGNKVITSNTFYRSGFVGFKITYTGESNFSVKLIEDVDDGSEQLLVNEVGNYKGEAFGETEASEYLIEVSADGEWEIVTFDPVVNNSFSGKLAGEGDTVSKVFSTPKRGVIKALHDGDGNFIVTSYDAELGKYDDLLVNDIGEYEGEKVWNSKSNWTVLEIKADGKWSIEFD